MILGSIAAQRFHALQAQLVDRAGAVRFDRTHTEIQSLSNLVVAITLPEQFKDLPLAITQLLFTKLRKIAPRRSQGRRLARRARALSANAYEAALRVICDRVRSTIGGAQ